MLGYLRNQRLVESIDDIESITVDWDVQAAAVKTRAGIERFDEKTAKRVVTTGCGQGTVFGDLMTDLDSLALPSASEPTARISQATLYGLLDAIRRQESTYKSAGSVHGCALFRQAELLTFVEDVGRHNAIDTIAGWMWLNDVEGRDKTFYTTGRLTSEMVIKSAQMGVPIVVSRSGVTQMGHEVASRLGLALFGRATNRHFLCYCGSDRFDAQPEPARQVVAASAREADFGERVATRHGPAHVGRGTGPRAARPETAQAIFARSRRTVGPTRRSISSSSGRFQPSANIASATMNIGPTSRPTRSSTNAGFLPSYQCPTNWMIQPTTKKPTPQAIHEVSILCANSIRRPTTTVTASAEEDAAAREVPRRRQREDNPGRRDQEAGQRHRRTRQQHADREHDHRHADQVADDVAAIAVVGGVLAQQIGGGAHGGSCISSAQILGDLDRIEQRPSAGSGRIGRSAVQEQALAPRARPRWSRERPSLQSNRVARTGMSIKSDKWIRRMARETGMIEPFEPGQVRAGGRRAPNRQLRDLELRLRHPLRAGIQGLHEHLQHRRRSEELRREELRRHRGRRLRDPAEQLRLARTVEYFRIPRNVLTICLGKSTYARCGIIVNVTPFEPEWEGYVTLEFSNTTPLPAKIYAGEGCAQVLFFESDEVCETSYKDRGGKYQGQQGVTLPKT